MKNLLKLVSSLIGVVISIIVVVIAILMIVRSPFLLNKVISSQVLKLNISTIIVLNTVGIFLMVVSFVLIYLLYQYYSREQWKHRTAENIMANLIVGTCFMSVLLAAVLYFAWPIKTQILSFNFFLFLLLLDDFLYGFGGLYMCLVALDYLIYAFIKENIFYPLLIKKNKIKTSDSSASCN